MKTISYAITACNEHVELERLLDQLDKHIRPCDEIMLQLDSTATHEVRKVAEKYNIGTDYGYHRVFFPLNNDFSYFKNVLKKHCIKDYIFFIDADEYLSDQLLEHLTFILENNDVDMYLVPRINTVKGLTEEHIKKWGWIVDENGWVNYPDYQTRIIKNNRDIMWQNKVHERIVGYNTTAILPPGFELIHPKTIQKQERQNNFYNTL